MRGIKLKLFWLTRHILTNFGLNNNPISFENYKKMYHYIFKYCIAFKKNCKKSSEFTIHVKMIYFSNDTSHMYNAGSHISIKNTYKQVVYK